MPTDKPPKVATAKDCRGIFAESAVSCRDCTVVFYPRSDSSPCPLCSLANALNAEPGVRIDFRRALAALYHLEADDA